MKISPLSFTNSPFCANKNQKPKKNFSSQFPKFSKLPKLPQLPNYEIIIKKSSQKTPPKDEITLSKTNSKPTQEQKTDNTAKTNKNEIKSQKNLEKDLLLAGREIKSRADEILVYSKDLITDSKIIAKIAREKLTEIYELLSLLTKDLSELEDNDRYSLCATVQDGKDILVLDEFEKTKNEQAPKRRTFLRNINEEEDIWRISRIEEFNPAICSYDVYNFFDDGILSNYIKNCEYYEDDSMAMDEMWQYGNLEGRIHDVATEVILDDEGVANGTLTCFDEKGGLISYCEDCTLTPDGQNSKHEMYYGFDGSDELNLYQEKTDINISGDYKAQQEFGFKDNNLVSYYSNKSFSKKDNQITSDINYILIDGKLKKMDNNDASI